MLLTEGQACDHRGAALMLHRLPPAQELIGDRGYDSARFRQALHARGVLTRDPGPPGVRLFGHSDPEEGDAMKRKRYTNEQIAFALRQAETGTTVEEVCRKLGVSEATFYRWRKQFTGMGVVEIRRLKQLEEESAKLKRLVADLSLDKTMLQDVLSRGF